MSSLISRTSILIISRLTNYSVALLSPIFLVRLLDVHTYGQYREFMLYGMLLFNFLAFTINSNLLYFIPKCPEKEKQYITHTALFSLTSFFVGVIVIYCGRNLILARTSYDFIVPLILYIFFTLNMGFWGPYWLGKKRSDYVFYFSSLYMIVRMITVICTAYVTRDVNRIIFSILVVEGIRVGFVLLFFIYKKSFTRKIDFKLMKEQLRYFIPMGIGNIIFYFNNEVSKIFISMTLGVEFLAIYAIGSYQVPINNIIRSSVLDVIFPEVTQRNIKNPLQGLELWKKSNIIFAFTVFPICLIFFYYADVFIQTLFTSNYAESIPIFRVYLFALLLGAFEMTIPIRSMNKNKYFVLGNIIRLPINLFLLVTLYKSIGFVGPAIAAVVSNFISSAYLAYKILKIYKIKLKDLLMWEKVFKIAGSALMGLPILYLGDLFHMNDIARAVVFSMLYFLVFTVSIYCSKIEEINLIMGRLKEKVKWVAA